ncbi:MAG: cell division protein FtsQ/DivIB [Desulfopila sp.]
MLQRRALRIQRSLNAAGRFCRQCFRELTGRHRRRPSRNSDLRHLGFTRLAEPGRRARRRPSLSRMRNTFRYSRRLQRDTFDPRQQKKTSWLRYVPTLLTTAVIVLFFFWGGTRLIAGFFHDISIFKVRELQIVGCSSASREELRRLTQVTPYQTSLLQLDTDEVAAKVEKDPWVSKAVVKRDWPSTLVVEVVEHQPVAMVNKSATSVPRLFYVDRTGMAFFEVRPGQDIDYPVITGLDRFSEEKERAAIFAEVYAFLKLAAKNNPNLPSQSVSEIHIDADGQMVIYLVDHTFPIFFGKGDIYEKYIRLVKVLEALYREKQKGMLISGVEYIQMDYLNDKVLVAQSESS